MNDRFFSAGADKGPGFFRREIRERAGSLLDVQEQRARDNWALLAAREAASETGRGLVVLFCFSPSFSSASSRHYSFLEGGLRETAAILEGYNIPLLFLYGDPGEKIPEACRLLDAALLVTDFDPYPEKRPWKKNALRPPQYAPYSRPTGTISYRRGSSHPKGVQCGHFSEKGRSPPRRMAPGLSAA